MVSKDVVRHGWYFLLPDKGVVEIIKLMPIYGCSRTDIPQNNQVMYRPLMAGSDYYETMRMDRFMEMAESAYTSIEVGEILKEAMKVPIR